MKNDPSETATAFFSVHVTCPTVYCGQIVSKAVCPTWCTYLYQEREKNWPSLENSSRSPLMVITLCPHILKNVIIIKCVMVTLHHGTGRHMNLFDYCQSITDLYCAQLTNGSARIM